VGRTRVHDTATAAALLDAAEAIVEAEGLPALTVRGVADAVGTTTRAVYSSLGSKEALLAGLGVRAFDLLGAQVAAVPRSHDPAADLVAAGAVAFRGWARQHPALFRIGFLHQVSIPPEIWSRFGSSAERALGALHELIRRVREHGGLGGRTIEQATWQFHALCEGLAVMELRAGLACPDDPAVSWADALGALVAGWRVTGPVAGDPGNGADRARIATAAPSAGL
jgi:AcrR family transcriptional regulator